MDRPQPNDRIAYYGRVSTPRQKLEHQRESVMRFAQAERLNIPPDRVFEDKVRRHRAITEGADFQRLMTLAKAGEIDWIVIATFDRWGIADKDDIFVWRKQLRKLDVQLWSVADELNVTGSDDGSFWRVAARAEAATAYVSQMAQKNIQKMVSMAEQGWAGTGNAPYGIDLVCYPVNDLTRPLFRVIRLRYKKPHLYRVVTYTADSRVERDEGGFITQRHLTVEREETTRYMPPRDKKLTGYRYEPSDEPERLRAVHLLFQLYADGMDFGPISDNLWEQGLKHYDKPFGFHGVETILSNPAYVGRPAWGKLAVGQYLHAIDKQGQKPKRKSTDPITYKKPESQWVMPLRPVFPPIVEPDLFEKVQKRLAQRAHTNPDFGKRRTRDRSHHPLNGKVVCPDCHEPMVTGASMPGPKSKGRKTRYHCFICGKYRRTQRKECYANSTRWDLLDEATERLLATVKDRIDKVIAGDPAVLRKEDWLKRTELGFLIWEIVGVEVVGEGENKKVLVPLLGRWFDPDGTEPPQRFDEGQWLDEAFSQYDARFEAEAATLRAEVAGIKEELADVTGLMVKQAKNPSVYADLDRRATELERRKAEIEARLIPLTGRARALIEQLANIRKAIDHTDRLKRAELFDAFLKEVVPILEVKETKGRKRSRRTQLIGFRFVPKEEAGKVLPEEMKILLTRTGTGSCSPPARSRPGRWSSAPPARL